jgi:SMC interacting uncharacterized protein involved in chromosome segregation
MKEKKLKLEDDIQAMKLELDDIKEKLEEDKNHHFNFIKDIFDEINKLKIGKTLIIFNR